VSASTGGFAADGNFPAEVSSFVGREAQLSLLLDLRPTTRIMTLVGPGGVGKSRLALRLGSRLRYAFRDGVWVVNLAALADQDTVAQAVADALRIRAEAGQSWYQTVTEGLRRQQLLLILDDCERVIVECAELTAALLRACPGLEVLATSREPLGVEGEVVWRVPCLSLPAVGPSDLAEVQASEAVQLFVDRVSARRPCYELTAANARSVAHICQRLGGLPLALELVAALVPGTGLDEIAARLDLRYALRLEGNADVLARHRTLRATLDWSYELLTGAERILLRRLAVFVGGWTLDAAEAVCADRTIPVASIVELLDGLVSQSLVAVDHNASPARYRLLDILRQYALELLQKAGEEEIVRHRHAEYVLRLTTRVHPARLDALHAARVEQDQGNLRAALRWLVRRGDVELAPRLAIAGYAFWYLRGRYAEGQAWLTRWLELPASKTQPHLRASVACLAGHLALLTGEVRTAHALLSAALADQQAVGNQAGIALANQFLALVAFWRGDLLGARALCEHGKAALETAEGDADLIHLIESALLTTSARTAWELGEERQAEAMAAQAVVVARARDDRFWLGRALHVQALVAWRAGQQLPALALIERAIALQRAHGDSDGLIDALCALGHFDLNRGWVDEGMGAFAEAVRVAECTGERIGLVWALEGLARGLGSRQPDGAARLIGACEALRDALGCPQSSNQRRRYNSWLARVRSELGASSYVVAKAIGRGWGLSDALRFVHELASRSWAGHDKTADSLTPREDEVATLLAQGLSNKDIALQLHVSVGTVRSHVDHILGKLGMHSRAQVAVWALHRSVSQPEGNPVARSLILG
jgi:predicted ATPase/DNA-binding CsgD family transcriptional regulator